MSKPTEQWHCPKPGCRDIQSFKAPGARFLPNGELDPDSDNTLYCVECDGEAVEGPLPEPRLLFNPTSTCKVVAALSTPFRFGTSRTLMDYDVPAHEFTITSRDLTMNLFAYRFHDGSLHVHEKTTGRRVPPLGYPAGVSLADLVGRIQALLDETPDVNDIRAQFEEFGEAGKGCEIHENYKGAMRRIKRGLN